MYFLCFCAKESNNKNRTMAVPSLKRLSPVMVMVNPGDAPKAFSKATTATGSVAAAIEPNMHRKNQLHS